MLRKLYKHEFYSMLRTLVPVYLVLFMLAVFSKITFLLDDFDNIWINVISIIFNSFFAIAIFAMFIVGIVVIVVRFYQNLLSKQGYLTFTLPFKAADHLNCKLICSVVLILLNVVALIIALAVLSIGTDFWSEFLRAIKFGWVSLRETVPASKLWFSIAEIAVLCIIAVFEEVLMLFVSMSIGQCFKNKIAGAVVAYIAIYSVLQIAGTILLTIISIVSASYDFAIDLSPYATFQIIMIFAITVQTALALTYYFVSRHLLTNKLNLE